MLLRYEVTNFIKSLFVSCCGTAEESQTGSGCVSFNAKLHNCDTEEERDALVADISGIAEAFVDMHDLTPSSPAPEETDA